MMEHKSQEVEPAKNGHAAKATLAVVGVIAVIIFAIALVIIMVNSDDSANESSTNTTTTEDSQPATISSDVASQFAEVETVEDQQVVVESLAEGILSESEETQKSTIRQLEAIAADPSKDEEVRLLSLDYITSECNRLADIDCFEDVIEQYKAADLDPTFAEQLLEDTKNYNEEVDEINAQAEDDLDAEAAAAEPSVEL